METIPDLTSRIKSSVGRLLGESGMVIIVVLIGLSSFGLGRISAQQSHFQPIVVHNDIQTVSGGEGSVAGTSTVPEGAREEGGYVASKSGKSYHLPWCPGAVMIAEKNKIHFATKEDAEAAGYAPAKNCKGI